MGVTVSRHVFSFRVDENVLKLDSSNAIKNSDAARVTTHY
jgi:hypothetical protein